MKIIYHYNSRVVNFQDPIFTGIDTSDTSATTVLLALARKYPEEILVWCDERLAGNLNADGMAELFEHQKTIISYHPTADYLPDAIGYVDESRFVKVNKNVRFPTWRMSSAAGAIHASVLNALGNRIPSDPNLDYFLNSLAKMAMPLGLFCYSEPRLLLRPAVDFPVENADRHTLFRFVKQHYKTVWVLLLFLDLLIYEHKITGLSLAMSLFYKKRRLEKSVVNAIQKGRMHKRGESTAYDVLIPTIGREKYLYDFLKDLAVQTILPEKVIIAEQNPQPDSVSALGYLQSEAWPFEIRHFFLHKPGACNARNLALRETGSDWIFFADDDIRVETGFMQSIFTAIAENTGDVFNICCLRADQKSSLTAVHQTEIFGSGCSIVSRKSIGTAVFDQAYEFGFGEDVDFAMQLANKGFDTTYLPQPQILHLKAPVGGFRTKPKLAWDNDPIQPKPSPTVMLYKLRHLSREQVLGYKTTLFFKNFKNQAFRNKLRYLTISRKKWDRSVFWANTLSEQK